MYIRVYVCAFVFAWTLGCARSSVATPSGDEHRFAQLPRGHCGHARPHGLRSLYKSGVDHTKVKSKSQWAKFKAMAWESAIQHTATEAKKIGAIPMALK